MTDKELLELAAKAAGIELKWMTQIGNGAKPDENFVSNWHPLTDDGDAMRLAMKLRLIVDMYSGLVMYPPNIPTPIDQTGDQYAATRRAIVRAAAEIGKNK